MRYTLATVMYLIVAASVAGATPAARPVLDLERTVVIDGPITGGNILALADPMLAMARIDRNKPIDIVISSPGGEIETGFLFINVMKSLQGQGVRIRCFVPTMAASMAFQLFVHCDERYALTRSFLLWHGVRVFVGRTPITQDLAKFLAEDLDSTNQMILSDLRRTLGRYIAEKELLHHFEVETFHAGMQLEKRAPGFLHSYDYIPGLVEALLPTTIPEGRRSGRVQFQLRPGTPIYIHTRASTKPEEARK